MITVDSMGKLCPLPIIDIALAVKDALPGTIFRLESDDPATWADLQAWGRMTGNHVRIIERTTFEVISK